MSAGDSPAEPPRRLVIKDGSFRTASTAENERTEPLKGPEIEVDSNEVRTATPAIPGARMVLDAGRGTPEGTRFRWVQVDGPPVELENPNSASVQITIPSNAEKLGFLVIAANKDSVRVVRVIVPLEGGTGGNSWGSRPSGRVKADAGDDQLGLVGHRVTLNGSKSRPADGKNSRWLQVAGPSVLSPQQSGPFLSFVPPSPGLYRFLLMVAGEGEVSEPDEVAVLVGSPPSIPGAPSQATGTVIPAVGISPPAPPTLEQTLTSALSKLPSANRVASDVADVMDAIAQRATLYESFASLQSELARRLDVVIPTEQAVRAGWNEQIFSPLTAFTANQMLSAGLDFRQQQTLGQTLTPQQKERVREHFQRLARAFRVVSAAR